MNDQELAKAQLYVNGIRDAANHIRRGLAWFGFFLGLGIALTNPDFCRWFIT